MYGAFPIPSHKLQAPGPLVLRGGLSRTFGGLAGFTALLLLSLGIYLLRDAFAHPVHAEPAGLFVAACAIALGVLLLFYLVRPRKTSRRIRRKALRNSRWQRNDELSLAAAVMAKQREARKLLTYRRNYAPRFVLLP
jgi:hypothetical protein